MPWMRWLAILQSIRIECSLERRPQLGNQRILLCRWKTEIANILPSTITEVSYGQDVHRRVGAAIGLAVVFLGIGALMALTKSK